MSAEFFLDTSVPVYAAVDGIEALEVFPCVSIDSALVKLAAENSLRYQISYRDGAIIAAAHRLGAKRIYSEDLNHGQDYGGAVVLNPFTA